MGKSFLPGIIAATVCIILITVVAVPIISDSTVNHVDLYENKTAGQTYTYLQDPADILIEYTADGYKLNGQIMPFDGNHTYSIITDSFVLDLGTESEKFDLYLEGAHTPGKYGSKLDLNKNGSWTYSNETGTKKTGSYAAAFYPSDSGDYAYYYLTSATNSHPFADNDSIVLYGGNITSVGHGAAIVDSMGQSSTFCPLYSSSGAVSITGIDVDVSAVQDVTSYKQYGGMTVSTQDQQHAVNSVLAPRLYHDVYPDDTIKSLVGIIPLLLIVTILIGIVGYVTLNKN